MAGLDFERWVPTSAAVAMLAAQILPPWLTVAPAWNAFLHAMDTLGTVSAPYVRASTVLRVPALEAAVGSVADSIGE